MIFRWFSFRALWHFLATILPTYVPKCTQNAPKILPKCTQNGPKWGPKYDVLGLSENMPQLVPLFPPLDSQRNPKWTKSRQKSSKTTEQKTHQKNIEKSVATNTPKSDMLAHVEPFFGTKRPLKPKSADLRKTEFGLRNTQVCEG